MAGGSQESGLSEIGLFRYPSGTVHRVTCPLTLGNVVDRHQDFAADQGFVTNLQRVREQRPQPSRRQLDVDWMILDEPLTMPEAVEKVTQRCVIKTAIVDRVEVTAD